MAISRAKRAVRKSQTKNKIARTILRRKRDRTQRLADKS
jgi:hypothetical protein